MAESYVQVATDGAGKQIDTFVPVSTHRQVVVLGDSASGNVVTIATPGGDGEAGTDIASSTKVYLKVWNGTAWDRLRSSGSLGGLLVAPQPSPTATTGSITSSSTTIGPVTIGVYDGISVVVSGTHAGVNFGFWGSNDNSVWFPLMGVRSDTGIAESTTGVLTANQIRQWDIAVGECLYFKVVSTAWTSGSAAINIALGMFAADPAIATVLHGIDTNGVMRPVLLDTAGRVAVQSGVGRTDVRFYAVAAAAGATTVETAISLTKSSGTSATSAAASWVVPSGKRFRITSIVFATRGNATATIQSTTFNLRVNTAGAVTTSSTPVILSARSATPATASAWDRLILDLPGDGLELVGDGTMQFGLTAAATFTTNAPTWDAVILGYEY